MKKIKNLFIIEKSQFNNFPKIRIKLDKYCYIFPTGNGFSKSMAELKFNSAYSSMKEDAYDSQSYMVTYAYTVFFLWLRIHIAFKEKKMGSSILKKVLPLSKSEKFIEDIIK